MTLGAADRQAEPNRSRRVGAIDGALDAELLGIGATFLIEGRIAMKPRRHELLVPAIGKHVAGELLDGESIERHVLVEGGNQPIAPGPDGAPAVDGVAVGVGVASQVEPVPRLPFAIMRRGQQTIDQFLVRIRAGIVDEGIDFRGCGQEAEQIQRQPANQRGAIGFRRWPYAFLLQAVQDEAVDRIANPFRVLDDRRRRLLRLDESPVRRILGALRNPFFQQLDFRRLESIARFLRRHPFVLLFG
jgi:hypothetical protein